MDLTDINPTIISTDNEDDEPNETTRRKRKQVKHSYKNPVVSLYTHTEDLSGGKNQKCTIHLRITIRQCTKFLRSFFVCGCMCETY